jgi:hypothetical protein
MISFILLSLLLLAGTQNLVVAAGDADLLQQLSVGTCDAITELFLNPRMEVRVVTGGNPATSVWSAAASKRCTTFLMEALTCCESQNIH